MLHRSTSKTDAPASNRGSDGNTRMQMMSDLVDAGTNMLADDEHASKQKIVFMIEQGGGDGAGRALETYM